MTVDRAYVLATPGLDRHAAYVAMSRHRDSVQLHYGRDDFDDRARLVHTLSRERQKDMASDYARSFADRRQIIVPAPQKAERSRDMFAGLKLRPPAQPEQTAPVKERKSKPFPALVAGARPSLRRQ